MNDMVKEVYNEIIITVLLTSVLFLLTSFIVFD